MSEKQKLPESGALEFFGRVCASVSHEIKNVFAVIGESNGLMEDLLLLHRTKGLPLDPDRFTTLAGRIRKHLGRGDDIVRNMNRFAHSVDTPEKRVDLGELTELVLALAGRMAAMRGVSLEPRGSETPVVIETNPFLLQQVLWICLDFATSACGAKKVVDVGLEADQGGARIALSGLDLPASSPLDGFPSEAEALMAELGSNLAADGDAGTLTLHLPRRIPGKA